jgi:glutamate formiminotransferase
MAWIEAVPNVSEGRRADVIDACATAITHAGGSLLDIHSDVAHNRSVFTFAGLPTVVVAAAHALVDTAVARIDLSAHTGVHPRIGVVDVIPFVPLGDATMDACVDVAREFGAALARRHQIPVFLYEAAAQAPHRRRLEAIRRGGLRSLTERMRTAEWQPDFGPLRPHPTAGVSVVGARQPLIAYNIDLATDRVEVASAIARSVRESSGGLPFVKALGLPLADRGIVQVSMNLTNFRETSIRDVFDFVCREAERQGVRVIESELVGLVPAAALTEEDARHLRIRGFDGTQILENRLSQHRRQ